MTLHEDYIEEVLADFEDFVEEWFDGEDIEEVPHDLDELFLDIDDDAFCSDAVTGNGECGYSNWNPGIASFWIDSDLMQVLHDYLEETGSATFFVEGLMKEQTVSGRCRYIDTWIRLSYYDYLRNEETQIIRNYCKHIDFELE